MKICDKIFNGGIDIVVSPYYDASQKDISSELISYLNIKKQTPGIYDEDNYTRCYMDTTTFFRSVKYNKENNDSPKYQFLITSENLETIVYNINSILENDKELKDYIDTKQVQLFIIVILNNESYKDFAEYQYHFFYMTEAKDIFGKVLLDVEDEEIFK